MDPKTNTLLGYGVIVGIITGLMTYFKSYTMMVVRVLWVRRMVPYDKVPLIARYLRRHARFIISDNMYYVRYSMLFSKEKNKAIALYHKHPKWALFLYKKKYPVLVANGFIYYIAWTFPYETMMGKEVRDRNYFYINRVRGSRGKDRGNSELQKEKTLEASISITNPEMSDVEGLAMAFLIEAFDNYTFRKVGACNLTINKKKDRFVYTKQASEVKRDIQQFLKIRNFCTDRGIPYRRGLLLHGRPGTGKSSLVKKICESLSLPLAVIDLSTMRNDDLFDLNFSTNTVVLIEDIDSVFDGRVNLTTTDQDIGLTFDCLINRISGVDALQNVYFIITTNHLDRLDPALIRDGRIDVKIELLSLNKEEQLELANRILEGNVDLISEAMNGSDDLSTAEFENRCIKLLMQKVTNETFSANHSLGDGCGSNRDNALV